MHSHFFCYSQLIGNITIRGSCRVQIYKSYMHEHFCFCSLTKIWYKCCVPTYWSCIHKCIESCCKIDNLKVNYLTENCLHADKKKSSNMVLTFTVAPINICVKWLLIVLYLSCIQAKKHVAVNSKKNCYTYRTLKTVHGGRACRHSE